MKLGLLHHDKQDGNQFKNHKTHWFDLEEVTNSQSGDKRAFWRHGLDITMMIRNVFEGIEGIPIIDRR